MTLQHLNDHELLLATKAAVTKERAATTAVLCYIAEVEARMLYAANHSSLFDWLTRELGYSEGQAQRRIDGSRLLKQLPALAVRLNSGALNLSHLSLAQSYFRREKKRGQKLSTDAKLTLLEALEGKSARETEKILNEKSGIKSEKTLKLQPTEEELKLLERVRALWAHKLKDGTWTEVTVAMARFVLGKTDPLQAKPATTTTATTTNAQSRTRKARGTLRRHTWQKHQGQCAHVGPDGKRCQSTYALEVDHRQPYALGGKTEPENLRLLCRTHNRYYAHQNFGREKMERHSSRACRRVVDTLGMRDEPKQ